MIPLIQLSGTTHNTSYTSNQGTPPSHWDDSPAKSYDNDDNTWWGSSSEWNGTDWKDIDITLIAEHVFPGPFDVLSVRSHIKRYQGWSESPGCNNSHKIELYYGGAYHTIYDWSSTSLIRGWTDDDQTITTPYYGVTKAKVTARANLHSRDIGYQFRMYELYILGTTGGFGYIL